MAATRPSAQDLKDKAHRALKDQRLPIVEVWTAHLPETHHYHENQHAVAISTPGARRHASEQDILDMAERLLSKDWGIIEYPEDIEQNNSRSSQEQGTIMGIYRAADGTTLWATQGHRYQPPTVMLPIER